MKADKHEMKKIISDIIEPFVEYIDAFGYHHYLPEYQLYPPVVCKCKPVSRFPSCIQCTGKTANGYTPQTQYLPVAPPGSENYDPEAYESYNAPIQRRIWGASRATQSQYLETIGALNVYEPPTLKFNLVNWNQMSDRANPHVVNRNVPSRGNSTKYSLTRHRPGAQSAPGAGVDVKHGSYDRYLARLKGKKALRTEAKEIENPAYGNKRRYYGLSTSGRVGLSGVNARCNTKTPDLCFK